MDVDPRVHIFAAMALGRGKVVSPILGRLYFRKSSGSHFAEGWDGPQDYSTHEGVKEYLHQFDTQELPDPSLLQ